MNRFLDGEISEKQLYDFTPVGITYEAVYLCSALVLEEYRRKGITRRLVLDAIDKIQAEHPVKALFAWVFSHEGGLVAESIANKTGLPLYKKTK
jgi:GNAT superfamily N-acetyltransferase